METKEGAHHPQTNTPLFHQTRAYTDTSTDTNTGTDTDTSTDTSTDTDTDTSTDTSMHRHRHRHKHAQTQTQTQAQLANVPLKLFLARLNSFLRRLSKPGILGFDLCKGCHPHTPTQNKVFPPSLLLCCCV